MADDSENFFQELGQRGHQPHLAKVTGSVRFELIEGDRADPWLVVIDRGDLSVSRAKGAADCTVRGDKALFEDLTTGRTNAIAAVLRGALTCTGDLELLLAMQRIFPDRPPEPPARKPARSAKMSERMVKILDGNTFVVSDASVGDIEASLTDQTRLFSFDMRGSCRSGS